MNRLIAVICSHHLHLLRNGEFNKFVFTAEGSTEDSTEEPNDESTSSENEFMHIIESDEVVWIFCSFAIPVVISE